MYQLNNSLFETDPVLALECSIKDFEISMREAEYMLEMVDYRNQLNCQRAELKVMMEHGGYEDLGYLYEAADEDKKKSEGGILSAIWNKIKGFFSDIAKAFKNLVSKGEPDKKYPFPQGFEAAMDAAMDAAGKTKEAVTSAAGKIGPGVWAAVVAAISAIGIAVTKWGKIAWGAITEKISGRKAKEIADKTENIAAEIENTSEPDGETSKEIKKQGDPKGEDKKNLFEKFKELLSSFPSKVGNVFSNIARAIRNVFSGKNAGDGIQGVENQNPPTEPENKDKDNDGKKDEPENKPADGQGGNPSGTDGKGTDTQTQDSGSDGSTDTPEKETNESAFVEATENLANLFALIDAL